MIPKANLFRLGTLVLACGLTTAVICSQTPVITPASVEEKAIAVAFFRYQLQQRSVERKWKVFYLAWGVDPATAPEKCVNAFRDHTPAVKKFIKSEYDDEEIKNEGGLVLGVAAIKQSTETEAAVEGYSFRLPYEAQGYRCQLARENGKWLVKSCKATWIA